MSYNVRIIEYPNQSVQIRVYDRLMPGDEQDKKISPTKVREPFSNYIVSNMDRMEINQVESIARSKRMIAMYSRCVKWQWFLTLTFAPENADRYNFGECSRKVQNWLRYIRKTKAPDLKFLLVFEPHEDGAWHIHGLFSDTGALDFRDSGKKRNMMPVYNLYNWRYGFSTCTQVRDTYRISAYIIKYITKSTADIGKWQHRYLVSRNLPRPRQIVHFVVPDQIDEWVTQFAAQIGREIAWTSTSHPGGYVGVTYIELQPVCK